MVERFILRILTEHRFFLCVFFLGLLCRLYLLGAPSFDAAEILTAVWVKNSFLDTISIISHSEFPPLYYLTLNLWGSLLGISEYALRFPSVIFSSLTIFIIYKLGSELFTLRTGIIAALLLAFSPFAIIYAQYAKMYALFWFLAASSFLYFFRFLKDQRNSSFVPYIVYSILCCYTLYTGFLLLIAQSFIFILFADKSRWKKWFVGQLTIVFLCLPWLVYFLNSSHGLWSSVRSDDTTFNYVHFLLGAFLFMIGSCRFNSPVDWLGVINFFLYIYIVMMPLISFLDAKIKKRSFDISKSHYSLWGWCVVPTAVYFLFDCFFLHVELEERYVGFLHVPILLFVSAQIDKWQNSFKKMVILISIVFVATINIYSYFKKDLVHPRHDWRKTAVDLTNSLEEGDIIVSFMHGVIVKYYFKGDTSRFFEVPEKDFSLESLIKKGILTKDVRSIFVVYNHRQSPAIKLDGFYIDNKVAYGKSGFLHLKRVRR